MQTSEINVQWILFINHCASDVRIPSGMRMDALSPGAAFHFSAVLSLWHPDCWGALLWHAVRLGGVSRGRDPVLVPDVCTWAVGAAGWMKLVVWLRGWESCHLAAVQPFLSCVVRSVLRDSLKLQVGAFDPSFSPLTNTVTWSHGETSVWLPVF